MNDEEVIKGLRIINKTRSYALIGKDLGVSTQSVYRWFNGRTKPSSLAFEKIKKYVKRNTKF